MSERFDIIVAGGGLVGGVFANLAAQSGLKVAVADSAPPPRVRDGDPTAARVVALSRGSQRLLRRIGAWSHIAPARRAAYEHMRIWDAQGDPFDDDALCFDSAGVGEPNLGHIVENDALVAAAHAVAKNCANISWQSGFEVAVIDVGDRQVRVENADGAVLAGRLLVAADGARSSCRQLLDIAVEQGAYQQNAIVSHLDTTLPHARTAYQRFLTGGPLAFLPLADGRSSLVWSVDVGEARRLLALDDGEFCKRVSEASAGVLGDVTACTKPLSFPLNWLHAKEYCRPRFAMIGDAAHCVHPLAGQGVNLGLLDAATLTEVLGKAQSQRHDIGDMRVLRRYARWRKSENGVMLAAFTGLNRLFGSTDPQVASVRRTGLRYVNRVAPLKRDLILRAMGVSGDLPRSVLAPEYDA